MRRSRRSLILLCLTILASLGVYLLGNGRTSLFDRDEPRYAECSREMLHGSAEHPGSDWVVPRFLGELRTAKPPGIYWCQGLAMKLLGDTAFAARLPSVIAMIVVLILWAIAIWRLAGPTRASWATFILATSVMPMASAKSCLTDAVLLVFITTAMLCLYAIYRGRGGWIASIVMCVSIGAAGLVKGPVIFAVMVMTIAVLGVLHLFTRRPRVAAMVEVDPESRMLQLAGKWLIGIAIVVGIVGPWLWAINKRAPDFLPAIIGHDVVARMKTGLEGHSAPPGYQLVAIWGTYFPWSIFLPLTFIAAWKRRHLPLVRFSFAVCLGSYLFFDSYWVKTKLPHYMLPAYPWMALLTADVVVRCLRGIQNDLRSRLTIDAMTVWGSLVALLGLAPWGFHWEFREIPTGATALWTLTCFAVAGVVALCFRKNQPRAGLIAMGVGSFAMVSVLYGVYLPSAKFLNTSIFVADELKKLHVTQPGQVQMLDYKEPTLAFYQGGTIRENSATVLTTLTSPDINWFVITDDVWKKCDDHTRVMFQEMKDVEGLAYADSMRHVIVKIVKRK